MLNNSLFDTFAAVDSIFKVESKDFIEMAKVALSWIHFDEDYDVNEEDVSKFFSNDELDFFKVA